MYLRPIAISIFALASSQANADWQYTRWGMSPSEVLNASGGSAQINTDRGLDAGNGMAKIVAPYRVQDFNFSAVFRFNKSDKLIQVVLNAKNHQCALVEALPERTYGPVQAKDKTFFSRATIWWDRPNKNQIMFYQLNDGACSVQYRPLEEGGAAGGL